MPSQPVASIRTSSSLGERQKKKKKKCWKTNELIVGELLQDRERSFKEGHLREKDWSLGVRKSKQTGASSLACASDRGSEATVPWGYSREGGLDRKPDAGIESVGGMR